MQSSWFCLNRRRKLRCIRRARWNGEAFLLLTCNPLGLRSLPHFQELADGILPNKVACAQYPEAYSEVCAIASEPSPGSSDHDDIRRERTSLESELSMRHESNVALSRWSRRKFKTEVNDPYSIAARMPSSLSISPILRTSVMAAFSPQLKVHYSQSSSLLNDYPN